METKTIETPISKHKVELKLWITGRDRRAIDSIYYADLDIGMKGASPEIGGVKGNLFDKAQDKTLEVWVVSVDGSNEKIVDKVLDMNAEDFSFVITEINKITQKKTE